MRRNYMMAIDSMIDTFSQADAAGAIRFSVKTKSQDDDLGVLAAGDRVLVVKRRPAGRIQVALNVLDVKGGEIRFRKILEVAEGIVPANAQELEERMLVELTDAEFELACQAMVAPFAKAPKEVQEEHKTRVTNAENVLLYGVPGSGKSYTIQTEYCADASRMERVVFHPEYTYSDFVGQVLPAVREGQLCYAFTPGPFTRMLKKAWENPQQAYFLIIEELNRGNAPAIFGEIFQLLDRKNEDSHRYPETEHGESEYGISNYEVALEVYGDGAHEVRIPSNMWVLATMNTADQNVFTMDTAFQRRWEMRHMKNDVYAAGHSTACIEGSAIAWGDFASVVNDTLLKLRMDMISTEDKRLGAFFVRQSELSKDKFSQKVLKYLWDDVFAMERGALFEERFSSLESVIEAFCAESEDSLQAVLRPDVYEAMQQMANRRKSG